MNSSLKYSVQIITGANQLKEALNLRYRVYRKTYPALIQDHNEPFESDRFDERSIHLGLYCKNANEGKLAGYCRLILPRVYSNDFEEVLVKQHSKYSVESKMTKERIALMERLPENSLQKVNSYCKDLEQKKIAYAETSRFIIEEEHRSLSLSAFFVHSMFAVCESLNIKYSFFTCTHHHVPFYSKYGLTLFPGIAPYDNAIFGKQYVIFGTDLNVESKIQNSINTLRLQLEEEKQITFRKAA
ncbi:MAG: GNAT family N-acetyltransferase [Bacteroidota bacterium]